MTTNQIGELNMGDNKFGLGFGIATEKAAAQLPVSEGTYDWDGIFGTPYRVESKEGILALLYTQKFPNSYGDLSDKLWVLVYQAIMESQLSSK
jgi:CubicO group peptidase (beta-lactamase class C family)